MQPSQPIILLLEDDAATRELYRRELSRTFCVVASGSEQEAADQLFTPEGAGGSAAEVAARIAALVIEPAALSSTLNSALNSETWPFIAMLRRRFPRLPIVVCSILDMRGRSAELGAAAYLIKPVTPAHLASTLAAVLGDWP